MASVYIIYSEILNKYYIGSCLDFSDRIDQHVSKFFQNSFTSKARDWKIYLLIQDLSYQQARAIERHIKKMKSRVYIQNLKKYPELVTQLIDRYSVSTER